jgi:intron-binding protein aquarius
VFLGSSDPSSAHYRNIAIPGVSSVLSKKRNISSCNSSSSNSSSSGSSNSDDDKNNLIESGDYLDTFIDAKHIIESFPNSLITFESSTGDIISSKGATDVELSSLLPPYQLVINRSSITNDSNTNTSNKLAAIDSIRVNPYPLSNPGPYPEDIPASNSVRYTSNQIEAIRSGMNNGLTMIVGPPGTGKTDTAVQIISNLYHNNPTQKILLVTHSNSALNDLFEKIMEKDVAPRHLLRLGSGERGLRESLSGKNQGEDFSKQGRVNWSLARRQQLLVHVQRLAASLNIPGDVGYTCETAEYFNLEFIQSRIEKYYIDIKSINDATGIEIVFPFSSYFDDAPEQIFNGMDINVDKEAAIGCFKHLNNIFNELKDYRAFELLRTAPQRGDYLLTKQVYLLYDLFLLN